MDLSQGPPRVRIRFPSALQLTLLVVQVSILYYGGHLVISGQMTSGNLISFIIYEFVLGDCMEVRGWLGEGSRRFCLLNLEAFMGCMAIVSQYNFEGKSL